MPPYPMATTRASAAIRISPVRASPRRSWWRRRVDRDGRHRRGAGTGTSAVSSTANGGSVDRTWTRIRHNSAWASGS
ncbi:hypothetical protein VR45_34650 [Streptomyces sp. NRRL S-495]|nr:hypothetical protein VR45_34650 [Streptomyces sp. NRRL S-495]